MTSSIRLKLDLRDQQIFHCRSKTTDRIATFFCGKQKEICPAKYVIWFDDNFDHFYYEKKDFYSINGKNFINWDNICRYGT